MMRNFRELIIWNDSRKLVFDIYAFTKTLPDSEKYGLISQINRASISVPANIAEGSAKHSNNDFKRFLQISLGSLYELETHLILCQDLDFGNTKIIGSLIGDIHIPQKKIGAFINKL